MNNLVFHFLTFEEVASMSDNDFALICFNLALMWFMWDIAKFILTNLKSRLSVIRKGWK